ILKICNALTCKFEIGSPLACLYLLGNPDHYSSHVFVPFYWRNYVTRVASYWKDNANVLSNASAEQLNDVQSLDDVDDEENMMFMSKNGDISGRCVTDNYVHRPSIYENVCLYDWIQYSTRK
ncbi:hypothetical protein BJ165DRAFT_1323260, partial [Panaeolus papilionaceus]